MICYALLYWRNKIIYIYETELCGSVKFIMVYDLPYLGLKVLVFTSRRELFVVTCLTKFRFKQISFWITSFYQIKLSLK